MVTVFLSDEEGCCSLVQRRAAWETTRLLKFTAHRGCSDFFSLTVGLGSSHRSVLGGRSDGVSGKMCQKVKTATSPEKQERGKPR